MPTWRLVIMMLLAVTPSLRAQRLPDDFQRGVNHAHVHRGARGYGSPVSATELAALRDLGVNSISLTPFGYQRTAASDEISFGRDRSMMDQHLLDEMCAAQALGMKAVLKPHVWAGDFGSGVQWHGTVDQATPEAHARWWTGYRALVLHYAGLAQRGEADLLCIGTELVRMTRQYPHEWRALIAEVRQVYHGPLTYAAHWHEEFEQITFWDALDFVGVGAYFPLEAPIGATTEQLLTAWIPHKTRLAALHQRVAKPILFMEAGYRAVSDCHEKPWLYSGGEPDAAAQARAYDAMFAALSDQPWWRGVYLWKTFTDPARRDGGGGDRDFTFRGRAAESVVRQWYATR